MDNVGWIVIGALVFGIVLGFLLRSAHSKSLGPERNLNGTPSINTPASPTAPTAPMTPMNSPPHMTASARGHAASHPEMDPAVLERFRWLVREKKKIVAIKEYRDLTGANLAEAKRFIETL